MKMNNKMLIKTYAELRKAGFTHKQAENRLNDMLNTKTRQSKPKTGGFVV